MRARHVTPLATPDTGKLPTQLVRADGSEAGGGGAAARGSGGGAPEAEAGAEGLLLGGLQGGRPWGHSHACPHQPAAITTFPTSPNGEDVDPTATDQTNRNVPAHAQLWTPVRSDSSHA